MRKSETDMSSSEEDDWVEDAAANIRLETLPEKSRKLYLKAYEHFMTWMKSKKIQKINENAVLIYFQELSKTYKPSTLWSKWSMVRSMVLTKNNIDISKFESVKQLLKRKNRDHVKKKSKVFTEENIAKFMVAAPDEKYLAHKMVMVLGVLGACRREEIYKLKFTDCIQLENQVVVKIQDAKSKAMRTFVIEGKFLKVYEKYTGLRVVNAKHPNFLLKYQAGTCRNQVIGKDKIGKMPKETAEFLKLSDPEKYTGHAYRRSSATILSNAGASTYELQQQGGWKSESVAKGYVEESIGNKSRMAQVLQNQIANPRSASTLPTGNLLSRDAPATITSSSSASSLLQIDATKSTVSTISHHEVMSEVQQEIDVPLRPQLYPLNLNMSNCSNCNINFNISK